jgi:cytochrome c peroxidase
MQKIVVLLFCMIFIAAVPADKKPTPYPFPVLHFFPPLPQSPHNPVTVEGADLGRHLFYDPLLSYNRDMSCATCHRQENAFSDAPNPLSKGNKIFTTRNTMPLFNLAWYPSFFWDGRASTIEEQVFHPLRDTNELNLPWIEAADRVSKSLFYKEKFEAAFGSREIDSTLISLAIGQFLRTLLSYQSKFDRVLAGNDYFNKDEYEGFVLMNDMTKGDCLHCHTTDANALGTIGTFSNNGLDPVFEVSLYKDKGLGGFSNDTSDYGKFKIPSLRNLALTAPYMHDGRFATLEEVLDFYSEGVHLSANIDSKMGLAHRGGVKLTSDEKINIIAFLNTLTDSTFITNPEFSNPFTQ